MSRLKLKTIVKIRYATFLLAAASATFLTSWTLDVSAMPMDGSSPDTNKANGLGSANINGDINENIEMSGSGQDEANGIPASNVKNIKVLTSAAPAKKNGTEEVTKDIIQNEVVQFLFGVLYTTVFILGIVGNVLVCFVVFRNRAMQTVTNIFITNLALSDILLCILAVPFTPLYTFMGRWAFGQTLCHLVSFAQGCSIYISTLTLTSIAIDRFFVIIFPFHPRMKLSTCICIIVSIWLIALLATVPYGMYMKVVPESMLTDKNSTSSKANQSFTEELSPPTLLALMEGEPKKHIMPNTIMATADPFADEKTYCEENWPSERYRKVFGSVTSILQFILPFVIISFCYIWISVKLSARAKAKPGAKSSKREEADRDRKRRTNRMLIAMVGVFGLSWLPLNCVNIFDDFYEQSNDWPYYTLFFFVAHSIAMSSTCYNPFLYAWLNENFRKEFKHVLPCFNPSNNNVINITRAYNRSDRNTCGPKLNNGTGDGAKGGNSLEMQDMDENGIMPEGSLPKDKLLSKPRDSSFGNGKEILSPKISVKSFNDALVHTNYQVQIMLNDVEMQSTRARNQQDEDYIDSADEQTVVVRFNETQFSSDNPTGSSMMEVSSVHEIEQMEEDEGDQKED